MSAQRLRDAAKVLRERAEAATPGPWHLFGMAGVGAKDFEVVDERRVVCDGCEETVDRMGCYLREDATYIATMHPGVALALADWLDDQADRAAEHEAVWESGKRQYPKAWEGRTVEGNVQHHYAHPLTVADLILGAE